MANRFINYKLIKFYRKYNYEYLKKKLFNTSAAFNLGI